MLQVKATPAYATGLQVQIGRGLVAIIIDREGAEWIADELLAAAPRDGGSIDLWAAVHEELDRTAEDDDG